MFTINEQPLHCDSQLQQSEGENAWRGNARDDFPREIYSAGEEGTCRECDRKMFGIKCTIWGSNVWVDFPERMCKKNVPMSREPGYTISSAS